jgi:hypothetical protein
MRRFVSSLLVSAALLGGVGVSQYALTRKVDFSIAREPDAHGHVEPGAHPAEAASYVLEITLGFTAGDDPFAVRTSADATPPRLVVRHANHELYSTTDELARGQTVTVPELQFRGDAATLFVEAVPGPEDAGHPCSLRLQMMRDDVACGAATLWSEGGGARLSGEVQLSLVPGLEKLDRGLGER